MRPGAIDEPESARSLHAVINGTGADHLHVLTGHAGLPLPTLVPQGFLRPRGEFTTRASRVTLVPRVESVDTRDPPVGMLRNTHLLEAFVALLWLSDALVRLASHMIGKLMARALSVSRREHRHLDVLAVEFRLVLPR